MGAEHRKRAMGWLATAALAMATLTPGALPRVWAGQPVGTPVAVGGTLPLGTADLPESRTTSDGAPSVTVTRIVRGTHVDTAPDNVDVAFEATVATALADRLAGDGTEARVEAVTGLVLGQDV